MKELQKALKVLSNLVLHNFQSPQIKRLVVRSGNTEKENLDSELKGGKIMQFRSRNVTVPSSNPQDLVDAVSKVTESFGKEWTVRVKHVGLNPGSYIVNALNKNQSLWIETVISLEKQDD